MGPHDHFEPISVQKLISHLLPKKEPRPSRRDCPSLKLLIFRVRPHEIDKSSFRRRFFESIDFSNLVKSLNLRGQSSMDPKNLIVNDNRQWKLVKHATAVFPDIRVPVLSANLVVKSINLRDLSAFVIST